jgi:monoamine oxidase
MSRSLYARLGRRFAPERFDPSRRDALKAALATGAGLLLTGCATPGSARWNRRVVVIGAGLAGLACAAELRAAGCDVTVLEARPRVGGRVLSFSDLIPGKNIEGGGELIGSNHPLWVTYAKRFRLEFLKIDEHEELAAPLVLAGNRLDDAKAREVFKLMDVVFKKMTDEARAVVEDEPWNTSNAEALDKTSTADWLAALDLDLLGKLGVAAELTANNCVAMRDQSYLGNLTQIKGGGLEKYWTDSEVYRCKGGNDLLAKALARAVGERRLKLGTPVTSIESHDSTATVTTADGRAFECDDVVLTVPPSVWSKIRFTPDLPKALTATRPQMGQGVKQLALVKDRFWLAAKASPGAMSDGDISMTWEATDGQSGQGPSCLTAFSGGPAAAACRAREKEARERAYARQLESLYPGFTAQFLSARFMDWPADPSTLASYSFPAPGQITTLGPLLQKPAGRVHFAGEHTCYKFVGYMEGALSSGVRVARRLARADAVAG